VSATTTAAEWLQMVSLAAGLYAAVSSPYFLLVDAEVWAWPRPLTAAVDRARPVAWDVVRSEAVYPLWREWDNARHTVREFGRDAAALVLLLTTSPKGALR
jgi:hypothetical protein